MRYNSRPMGRISFWMKAAYRSVGLEVQILNFSSHKANRGPCKDDWKSMLNANQFQTVSLIIGEWLFLAMDILKSCCLRSKASVLFRSVQQYSEITILTYYKIFADLNSSNQTEYNSTLLCPKLDGLNGSLLIPVDAPTTPYWGLHSTVPIYVAVIVFPLLNFKNVSFFTKFNSLGKFWLLLILQLLLLAKKEFDGARTK